MSVVRFTCPHCRRAFEFGGPKLNELGACPACGSPLLAPAASLTDAVWFYSRYNQKFGPLSLADLQQFAAQGLLSRTDWVMHLTEAKWVQAHTVAGIFPQQGSAAETR